MRGKRNKTKHKKTKINKKTKQKNKKKLCGESYTFPHTF